jgi:hypothetical protein
MVSTRVPGQGYIMIRIISRNRVTRQVKRALFIWKLRLVSHSILVKIIERSYAVDPQVIPAHKGFSDLQNRLTLGDPGLVWNVTSS